MSIPQQPEPTEIDVDENDMIVLIKKNGPLMSVEDFMGVYTRYGYAFERKERTLVMIPPSGEEKREDPLGPPAPTHVMLYFSEGGLGRYQVTALNDDDECIEGFYEGNDYQEAWKVLQETGLRLNLPIKNEAWEVQDDE